MRYIVICGTVTARSHPKTKQRQGGWEPLCGLLVQEQGKGHAHKQSAFRALTDGKTLGNSSVRKTKGVCENAGCAARGQRASVRGAAMQTGKMSNKRKKLLTAALRALCGRAGDGREKRKGKTRRNILLQRVQTVDKFTGKIANFRQACRERS